MNKPEGFIRIPKTASSSLSVSLLGTKIKFTDHGYFYRHEKGIINYSPINRNLYGDLYAVVRNPFDLLVSYYHHTHEGSNKLDGWNWCNIHHGFKSWREFLNAYIDPNFKWHLVPMKKSLFSMGYDAHGDWLIKKHFYYENLDELNEFLLSKGGKKLDLLHVTKGRKTKNYKEFYNNNDVESLNRIWEKDLKRFNYSF